MLKLTCLSPSSPLHLLLLKKQPTNCSLHSNCTLWQLLPHAVDLPLCHWVVQSQAQAITKILMHHDASSKSRLWMKQKRMEMLQANRILQSKWAILDIEAPFNKKQWINSTYQLGARLDSYPSTVSYLHLFHQLNRLGFDSKQQQGANSSSHVMANHKRRSASEQLSEAGPRSHVDKI